MALRDRLKKSVRSLVDRLSGEHSAAATEIREPPPEWQNSGAPQGEVKITRARLNRPPPKPADK